MLSSLTLGLARDPFAWKSLGSVVGGCATRAIPTRGSVGLASRLDQALALQLRPTVTVPLRASRNQQGICYRPVHHKRRPCFSAVPRACVVNEPSSSLAPPAGESRISREKPWAQAIRLGGITGWGEQKRRENPHGGPARSPTGPPGIARSGRKRAVIRPPRANCVARGLPKSQARKSDGPEDSCNARRRKGMQRKIVAAVAP